MIKGKEKAQRIVNLLSFLAENKGEDGEPTTYRVQTSAQVFEGRWTDTDWENEAICIQDNGLYWYILAEHITAVTRAGCVKW